MKRRIFMNRKMSFAAEAKDSLSESLSFIEGSLTELGINRRLVMSAILSSEELIAEFLENAAPGASLRVTVRKLLGDASISIQAAGREVDLFGKADVDAGLEGEPEDEDFQRALRAILLRSRKDRLEYSYKNGVNRARITTGRAGSSMLLMTVSALLLGLMLGLAMKFLLAPELTDGLQSLVLNPIKTMFMNALKIVIGPVVFFSIASCIAQFKDLSELGRIGVKVMGMYSLTTLIAVIISAAVSFIVRPGEWGFALALNSGEAVSINGEVDTSILHTIINIVPGNIVRPFLEADTLQLIFLAVLFGLAAGRLGEHSPKVQEFFDAANSLFLTLTTMISRFIPLAVFCSASVMTLALGGGSLLNVLEFLGTQIIVIICMLLVYALLILIVARLNPLIFYKKHRAGMLTGLSLASSSATIPVNMRTCTERLGVSEKVCSFSIPLGATVNMDGSCVLFTVGGLFLARAYAVEVPGSAFLSLAITIILLSLGAPGVPGSGIVCISVVLGSLGVPIEAVGIIMGVYPLLDMIDTMTNITGDVAVSLITAKSEGMLDTKMYNDRSL